MTTPVTSQSEREEIYNFISDCTGICIERRVLFTEEEVECVVEYLSVTQDNMRTYTFNTVKWTVFKDEEGGVRSLLKEYLTGSDTQIEDIHSYILRDIFGLTADVGDLYSIGENETDPIAEMNSLRSMTQEGLDIDGMLPEQIRGLISSSVITDEVRLRTLLRELIGLCKGDEYH